MLHSNRKGEITSQYYTGTSLILKGEKNGKAIKSLVSLMKGSAHSLF